MPNTTSLLRLPVAVPVGTGTARVPATDDDADRVVLVVPDLVVVRPSGTITRERERERALLQKITPTLKQEGKRRKKTRRIFRRRDA